MTAVDRDTGVNGQISYAIVEGNEAAKFGIFPDGLLYVRSPLDREVKDYYALTVLAKDNGTPPRRSVAFAYHNGGGKFEMCLSLENHTALRFP